MSREGRDTPDQPDGPPERAAGSLTDTQQWTLAVLLLISVLGFPVAILLWPPTVLSYRDAFLALAMVPGVLLGVTGLWLALGGRK